MKRIALMLTIILTLAPLIWSQSNVNEMHLKRIHGETVLRIDASGPFQYSHQVENAKDGKPFRIIVDIFPAVHNFGQKIFNKMPASIVTALRTSQYATKPEKIVRVVLDLQKSAAYRIEKSGNYIFVYIPDTQAAEFPEWASATAKTYVSDKPAVAAVEPKLDSKDVTKPAAETKPAATVVKTETKSPAVTVVKTDNQPAQTTSPAVSEVKTDANSVSDAVVAEVKPESTPSSTTEKLTKAPAKTEPVTVAVKPPVETKTTTTPTDVTEKPVVQASADVRGKQSRLVDSEIARGDRNPSSAPSAPVTVSQNNNTAAATPKQKPAEQPKFANPPGVIVATKGSGTTEKPQNAPEENAQPEDMYFDSNIVAGANSPDNLPAIETPVDTTASSAKPTSRFRRDATFPNKLKGTLVAEFPQRMVIEYAPGDFRDPFETLIDDTRQSHGPRENRIPDVETSRLVGVLESNNGDNRALLEDMDGYGYILKAGDKVKKGYVDKINSDKAFFQLFEYGWSRTIALFLGHN